MAGLRETTAAEQQEGAGYLVGDEVCALFAGALTFREQCVAAGILYKDRAAHAHRPAASRRANAGRHLPVVK